jgi:hypothetical protein
LQQALARAQFNSNRDTPLAKAMQEQGDNDIQEQSFGIR